jgi:hypothetical protein
MVSAVTLGRHSDSLVPMREFLTGLLLIVLAASHDALKLQRSKDRARHGPGPHSASGIR